MGWLMWLASLSKFFMKLALILSFQSSHAVLVDFEGLGAPGTAVSTLTFDDFSMINGRIASPGGTTQAFGVSGGTNDDAGSGDSVTSFKTGATPLELTFFQQVYNVSFDIADLDFENSVVVNIFSDASSATADEVIALTSDPSLDGQLFSVSVSTFAVEKIAFGFSGDDYLLGPFDRSL